MPVELPSAAETQMLLQQPAIRAVLQAFPEAVLHSITPVAYPPPAPADAEAREPEGEPA